MKIILKINNSLFCVSALTEKNAEKKAKKIIEEIVFDPYGYIFKCTLIKGSKTIQKDIKISNPFKDSDIFDIWPE